MISFTCKFPLIAKARPRFERGHVYTPKKTQQFETAVAFTARNAMKGADPIDGPCSLEIYALFQVPTSWPKWKKRAAMGKPYTGAGDADNMVKAVSDALNKVAYADDRQVAHVTIQRIYGDRDIFRVTLVPHDGIPATRAEAA